MLRKSTTRKLTTSVVTAIMICSGILQTFASPGRNNLRINNIRGKTSTTILNRSVDYRPLVLANQDLLKLVSSRNLGRIAIIGNGEQAPAVKFFTPSGNVLEVAAVMGEEVHTVIRLAEGNRISTVKISADFDSKHNPDVLTSVEDLTVLNRVSENAELTTLLREVSLSLNVPDAGSGFANCDDDPLACAASIIKCYGAILTYVGSMVGLVALCPETAGITCYLALLAHPALAAASVVYCAQAINCLSEPSSVSGVEVFGDSKNVYVTEIIILDDEFEIDCDDPLVDCIDLSPSQIVR